MSSEVATADQGIDLDRLERVNAMLRNELEHDRMHGAAFLVSRRGEIIVDFLEGYADKASGRPLQRNSVYFTLSVAKPMTNVLVLSLVEKGLLRLHSPVADVIPEFAQLGKDTITLFQLMTHMSGIPGSTPPLPDEVMINIEKLTTAVCASPLECLPGERVNYSMRLAHSVMASMCLRVDGRGRNYATMLEEDLWQPLGMGETSLGPRDDLLPRVCPMVLAQKLPFSYPVERVAELVLTPGAELPSSGVLTTIGDLHKFSEMLRRGGELNGNRILSPATLRYAAQIFTGDMRNNGWDVVLAGRKWNPFPANLGIGFHIRGTDVRPGPFGMLNSPGTFGHFGAGSAGTWVDPEYDLSFSFLSTGLIEDSHHLERTAILSDLVVSALVD